LKDHVERGQGHAGGESRIEVGLGVKAETTGEFNRKVIAPLNLALQETCVERRRAQNELGGL